MESTEKEHTHRRRKRRKKKVWVADQVDTNKGPSVIQVIIAIVVFVTVVAIAVKLLILDDTADQRSRPTSINLPK